jgi:hypothetical protein
MKLQRTAKETDEFCVEDLRSIFQLRKTLEGVMSNLAFVTKWVWSNRDRNEYIRIAAHKITEAATIDLTDDAHSAATPPTSRLTNGTLQQIYNYLIMDGAGVMGADGKNGGAIGMADGMPIFALITDANTSGDLIRQDPEVRQDFRYANPNILIQPLGVSKSYNGFKHILDPFPQRFNKVGNDYVRIKPFRDPEPTTKGVKRVIEPNYLYAEYQISVIHVRNVYTQRVPKPITNPGGGFKFDPVNYMGEFKWKNILDRKCNPDGTKGFFRGVFSSASEPIHPEFGWAIMHKNCPPKRDLKPSCYS